MPDETNEIQKSCKRIALNSTIAGSVVVVALFIMTIWDVIRPDLSFKIGATAVAIWVVTGIICYSVFKQYEVKQDKDDLY